MSLCRPVCWPFAVEIVVQSCEHNSWVIHSGSEGLALAGIHQNVILKWLKMCCWSGWITKKLDPKTHTHRWLTALWHFCLIVMSPHFTWSADTCGHPSASVCWGRCPLVLCGSSNLSQSTVYPECLQGDRVGSFPFPRCDCCKHDAELQSKVSEESKTNKHKYKTKWPCHRYLNHGTSWIKKKYIY